MKYDISRTYKPYGFSHIQRLLFYITVGFDSLWNENNKH